MNLSLCFSLQIITSSNCLITDPNFNHTFDFTSLHSDLGHLFKFDNATYKINVCKSDIKCSQYNDTVAACETKKPTSEIVLGYNSTLTWEDGRISFDFVGEQCTESEKYSLKTILLCTYNPQKIQEPIRILPKRFTDKCKNVAYWETDAACLPKYSNRNACVTKGRNGKDIDLNELYEMNHKVLAGDGVSYFYINLCQPVLYGINVTCPLDASICYVDKDETDPKKKFQNYGSLKNIAYEDEQYVLHYETTEKCPKDSSKSIRSKIILDCYREEEVLEPVFIKETNDCENIFTMKTSLVCDINRACFVFDSRSGTSFNLSSLANRTFSITHNETQLTYGICSSPLKPCLDVDGACEGPVSDPTKRNIGYGQFSSELLLNGTDNHVTYVEYNEGTSCTNDTKWRTQILFHCDENGKDTSKVIEDGNCTLVISHPTNLMCSHIISCTGQTDDGHVIDLTRLKEHHGNFLATVDPKLTDYKFYKFYLHVCRPLYLEPGLNCPGSSACRTITVKGKEEHETSLGYPDVSLTMVDNLPVLKYLHGGICEKDNTTNLSTEIQFMCDPKEGDSVPILTEVQESCHYIFKWATNKICDPKLCSYDAETCSLSNPDLNASVNLKKIFGNEVIPVKHKSGSININLCNKTKDAEVLAQYKDDTVIFKFKAKEHNCNKNNTNGELKLVKYETRTLNIISFIDPLAVVLQLKCGRETNQSSFANVSTILSP